MEHQILTRNLVGENETVHLEKEEEFPKLQVNAVASKTRRYAVLTRVSPINELLSTNSTVKSKLSARAPAKQAYPSAVLNAGDHSISSANVETPLKGTPWEDAVLRRDSQRIRKRSSEESVEEQQCTEFLELFG